MSSPGDKAAPDRRSFTLVRLFMAAAAAAAFCTVSEPKCKLWTEEQTKGEKTRGEMEASVNY